MEGPKPVSPTDLRNRIRKPQKTSQLFTADQHKQYDERIQNLREEIYELRERESEITKTVEREQSRVAALQRDNKELQESISFRETAYKELMDQHTIQTGNLEKSKSVNWTLRKQNNDNEFALEETETMKLELQKEREHWRQIITKHEEEIAYQKALLDMAEAESTDFNVLADLSAANLRLNIELQELKKAQPVETRAQEDPEQARLLAQMATATRSTEKEAGEWLQDLQKLLPAAATSAPDPLSEEQRRLLNLMSEMNQSTDEEYNEWLADVEKIWPQNSRVPEPPRQLATEEPHTAGVEPSSESEATSAPTSFYTAEQYATLPHVLDSDSDDEFFNDEAAETSAPAAPAVEEQPMAEENVLAEEAAGISAPAAPAVEDQNTAEENVLAEEVAETLAPTPPAVGEQLMAEEDGLAQGVAETSAPAPPALEDQPMAQENELAEEVDQIPLPASPIGDERHRIDEPEIAEGVAQVPAPANDPAEERPGEFDAPSGHGPGWPITRRVGGEFGHLQTGQREPQGEPEPAQVHTGPNNPQALSHSNLVGGEFSPNFTGMRDGSVWIQDFGSFSPRHTAHDDYVGAGNSAEKELREGRVVTRVEEHDDAAPEDEGRQSATSQNDPATSVPIPDGTSTGVSLEDEMIPHDFLRRHRRDSYPSTVSITEDYIQDAMLQDFGRADSISSASSSEEAIEAPRPLHADMARSATNVQDVQQAEATTAPAGRRFSFEVLPLSQWTRWNVICAFICILLLSFAVLFAPLGWHWTRSRMHGKLVPNWNAIVGMGYAIYAGLEGWTYEKAMYQLIEWIGGHDLIHEVYGLI